MNHSEMETMHLTVYVLCDIIGNCDLDCHPYPIKNLTNEPMQMVYKHNWLTSEKKNGHNYRFVTCFE